MLLVVVLKKNIKNNTKIIIQCKKILIYFKLNKFLSLFPGSSPKSKKGSGKKAKTPEPEPEPEPEVPAGPPPPQPGSEEWEFVDQFINQVVKMFVLLSKILTSGYNLYIHHNCVPNYIIITCCVCLIKINNA